MQMNAHFICCIGDSDDGLMLTKKNSQNLQETQFFLTIKHLSAARQNPFDSPLDKCKKKSSSEHLDQLSVRESLKEATYLLQISMFDLSFLVSKVCKFLT